MLIMVPPPPTQDFAKVLRATDPKNYPDDNHKPEMAIALTPFDVGAGDERWFAVVTSNPPPPQIAGFMDTVPEFRAAVGEETAAAFTEAVHKPEVGVGR
jgi:mannose-6-phosphate isomerase